MTQIPANQRNRLLTLKAPFKFKMNKRKERKMLMNCFLDHFHHLQIFLPIVILNIQTFPKRFEHLSFWNYGGYSSVQNKSKKEKEEKNTHTHNLLLNSSFAYIENICCQPIEWLKENRFHYLQIFLPIVILNIQTFTKRFDLSFWNYGGYSSVQNKSKKKKKRKTHTHTHNL